MENKKTEKLSRKERETQLRKQIILEVAEKLFLSKGYDETTMDEIANEAEFSKGTVYKYFDSKDELYLAIGIKAYELIIEYTKDYTSKEEPGIQQLMAVGKAFYQFSKDYPAYANIFHEIGVKLPEFAIKPKNKLSQIESDYLNISQSYGNLFIKIMSDAVKVKAIRSDVSPNLIGYVLSTITRTIVDDMIHSEVIIKRFKLTKDEVINFVIELLADGLKPRDK